MSDLVGTPEDRFSHSEAHIMFTIVLIQRKTMLKTDRRTDRPVDTQTQILQRRVKHNTNTFQSGGGIILSNTEISIIYNLHVHID